jgi:hypothetical protein
MSHFANKLVLAQWALQQLGMEGFDRLSEMLRAPEFEGWAEDGGSKYVEQLIARLPRLGQSGRTVSNLQLRDYDANIVGHWKHITQKRNLFGQTLYPLYFQYLGLLLTEMYLDRYFQDGAALQDSLNIAVQAANKQLNARNQIELFAWGDLNKIAFWMATGSGKTLLMHCHIRQYLHYLGKAGKRRDLNRIILLTPNEGLSRQHKEEFELSVIEADFYDKEGVTLFTGRGVDIIDIHKLRETSGEKTVAVDTFEGNNLVLVDEGHRGAGGEEWMDKRARLCSNGFSFEYSATFGQAIKAASGAKQGALTQTYAKCILFDYSYRFFYNDGFGKDFNILNLAEEHEEETRPLYLTACLLAFYQQCRRFRDDRAALLPYLLESPLMVFVGGSVTGQRQTQEDTDLVQILKFLATFISGRKESEKRLEKLLQRRDGLVAGGRPVFDQFFSYIETRFKPNQASELFADILECVFHASNGGQLHIVHLQGSDGEIGLRIGEGNPWFGVVNVGDSKKLCDLCAKSFGEDEHCVVDELKFSGSLFDEIKRPGSSIRILAGAKKFTEGWNSWRVSAMGLMNVGRKEGSEIIQLFGRGVRLKGFKFKLKRTSALDALDFQADDLSRKHPDHIALLETLNIFGIKSDYMKEFEEYLEEEGLGEDERRELVFLPTITLSEFERGDLELHVIRPKADMPDFKKAVKLTLNSLEGKLNNKVIADWYPRLQKQSSISSTGSATAMMNKERIKANQMAFHDWNAIWFELERHKRDKAYYNLLICPEALRNLMQSSWWYELYIPPGYLDFRFDRLGLYQDIVVHLLKAYADRFYQFHRREFETPFLEYHRLTDRDELILRQYQLLVKKSEKELINQLRDLSKKFEAGTFEAMCFQKLEICGANHHLYNPLIHLSHNDCQDSLVKIIPTHLNTGEKQFVNDLEAFCKAEVNGMLANTELYLLRNHSSDRAVSFFAEAGFRPDFVLWLLNEHQPLKQCIAFIDPKGLRNFTDTFNNPKVKFFRQVKELEVALKRADIRLESFLISQTYRNDLRWPNPTDPKKPADAGVYKEHHILCAKDDPTNYVGEMIAALQS